MSTLAQLTKMAETQDEHNAVALISGLKKQLMQTLTTAEGDDVRVHRANEDKLEQMWEKVVLFMCGNFYTEPAKDIFEHFQLEREILEQDVLGFFIVNLDRMTANVLLNLIRAFHHIISQYVYQTRQPLVEMMENNDYLLERLCRFLCCPNKLSTTSTVASSMLASLCKHSMSLARKLVNMLDPEDSTSTTTFYLRLLKSLPTNCDPARVADQFKFLESLLLSHDDVANYAFTRDLNVLIAAFNQILSSKCHFFIRYQGLVLFGSLIQNCKLKTLLREYTGSLDNFKLFFQLSYDSQAASHGSNDKNVIIKTFEIFRLFFLNSANKSNEEFKKFINDNCLTVVTIVDRAEKVRSYSDVALMYSEYEDIRAVIDVMTGKTKPAKKVHFGRSESNDEL